MAEINRSSLFGKLNPQLFHAAEAATVFCKRRGNPYVELAHWLHQILQGQDNDILRVIRHYGLDLSRIQSDVTAQLERLPRGASAIADFSMHIDDAIERAWLYATLLYGDAAIRSGYLLVGLLKTPALRSVLHGISAELCRLEPAAVAGAMASLCTGSPEEGLRANDGTRLAQADGPGAAGQAHAGGREKQGQALQTFATDLTARALQGGLDPVCGRDDEIRQVIDILTRRRQNNPLLTGEAGVGKTAVVEGLASRIAAGDVPPALRGIKVLALDIGLLQAGASMKGEFEQRLRNLIDEAQASPAPVVLFIDEIHTLVGAGGAAGTGDAANLLKPALARGALRTIGATTWAEYKRHIEKDPALTRRFQAIPIDEPSEAKAIVMLRGLAEPMEAHHKVLVLDEAIEAAVKLSHRYIPSRQLPDKAVSLLDTACARVSLTQHATPPVVAALEQRIQALERELAAMRREAGLGMGQASRIGALEQALAQQRAALAEAGQRWDTERRLVGRLLELRGKLQAAIPARQQGVAGPEAAPSEPQRAAWLAELAQAQQELAQAQGESALILPAVDGQAIAQVVADWTGIPVGRMVRDEISAVLNLADALSQRVVGQRHGLELIARQVEVSRARLDDPGKPVGVFMLAGPSGVGKTETALALAEALYGGEQNVITINMSEFQEAHTVSSLKGAPPGYVGYGEGGVLTEAVRRKPYSVVLLDEIEKAHPDVHEIFFQVFDKGWMEDGEGRRIDFRNTIIILTSNLGADLLMGLCRGPGPAPAAGALADAVRAPLREAFPDAFLGRLTVIAYLPLGNDALSQIVALKLARIQARIHDNHGASLSWDDAAVQAILARATQAESGGRMIDAILSSQLLPHISREYLQRALAGSPLAAVHVGASSAQLQLSFS